MHVSEGIVELVELKLNTSKNLYKALTVSLEWLEGVEAHMSSSSFLRAL